MSAIGWMLTIYIVCLVFAAIFLGLLCSRYLGDAIRRRRER